MRAGYRWLRAALAPAPTAPDGGLRRRAARAGFWVVFETAARLVLKTASSLILTRLLFPKAFGLVATLSVLVGAIEMCSDLGIRQALIQNPQGDRRRYLDTAWTMALIRSIGMAVVMALLAWPCAQFFQTPELFEMWLVVATTPVIRALASPATYLWARRLEQLKLTVLELSAQVAGIVGSISGALIFKNAWGLVLGSMLGDVAYTVGSYVLEPGWPRLRWSAATGREFIRFGRFVFVSSLLGFFATRLDAVFVAKFLGMEQAGVYYIATTLALFVDALLTKIMAQVVFPALSRFDGDARTVRARVDEVLGLAATMIVPASIFLMCNGAFVLGLLFDHRYAGAAIPLAWLLLSACLNAYANAVNSPLMASGHPQFGTLAMALKLAVLAVAAPLLGARYHASGYAAAMALSSIAFVVPLAVAAAIRKCVSDRALAAAFAWPAVFGLVLLGLQGIVRAAAPAPLQGRVTFSVHVLALVVALAWNRARVTGLFGYATEATAAL